MTADTETGPIRGKERIRALPFNFLVPLHVMVEIGGLAIHVRESPIHGDAADETHSAGSVDLIGVSGRTCNLAWYTLRRWAGSRVVYERHYDHQQTGGPLTGDDLSLSPSPASFGDRRRRSEGRACLVRVSETAGVLRQRPPSRAVSRIRNSRTSNVFGVGADRFDHEVEFVGAVDFARYAVSHTGLDELGFVKS